MAETKRCLSLAVMLLLGASMGDHPAAAANLEKESHVTKTQLAADLATVRQGRILFSHMSVGTDILAGIKQLDAEIAGGGRLRPVSLQEAVASEGPALIDVSGGRNGEPRTKIDFFATTIRGGARLKPNLAFMKFCYVDFNPRTDIDDLFGYYRNTLEGLKREHPEIRFAHVTVPLMEQPTGLKWRLYRLIGREVWEDAANVKRAQFNQRLQESFGSDPVFDIARVEATTPDGRLTTFEQDGRSYLSLYPGYTEDGGHLNTAGQRAAGTAAIRFLAEGLKGRGTTR
jgi:hypothetical protein